MSLHACVRCDCWERGLAAPTPLAARIHLDEDGDLDLHPPAGAAVTPREDHDALQAWRAHACSHPDMHLVHTQVGNWHRCDALREALLLCAAEIVRRAVEDTMARPHGDGMLLMERSQRYGPVGRFATLLDELPDCGIAGGTTAPERARRMLDELKAFERHGHFGVKFVLRDADTGEALWATLHGEAVWNAVVPEFDRWWTRLPPEWDDPHASLPTEQAQWRNRRPARHAHLFAWQGPVHLGVDSQGLVVQDAQGRPLFRSRHFTQDEVPARPMHPTPSSAPARMFLLRDQASGESYACPVPIGTPPRRRLFMETLYQSPADHGAATGALRRLCGAALQTGHPIEWS